MPADLIDYLEGESIAPILHRQDDRQNLQVIVKASADRFDGREQLRETLERVILALHGDDDGVSSSKGVDRQKPKRRRAVDQYRVVVSRRPQSGAKAIFARHQRDELDLGSGHIRTGGDDVEAPQPSWHDRVLYWSLLQNEAVNTIRRGLANSEPACGVRLRIQIDD